MAKSKYRGHDIECINDEWVFSENHTKVRDNPTIECKNCSKDQTEDGHDGCLGNLVGLINACCGHGEVSEAYVQFFDGNCIRGQDAIDIQNVLEKQLGR